MTTQHGTLQLPQQDFFFLVFIYFILGIGKVTKVEGGYGRTGK